MGALAAATTATITVSAVPVPLPPTSSSPANSSRHPRSRPRPSPPFPGIASARRVKVRFENTNAGGQGSFTKTLRIRHGQVKVHNLRFHKTGVYNELVLSPSDSSASQQLTVIPAAPRKLIFSTQPLTRIHASATVAIVDQFGNPTTAADGQSITPGFPHHAHRDHHRTFTGSVTVRLPMAWRLRERDDHLHRRNAPLSLPVLP